MLADTLGARWEEWEVERGLRSFALGRGGGSRSTGEETELPRDLPRVITLHWMIAECCRGTQACNLLVATI